MPLSPESDIAPASAAETLVVAVVGDRWIFAVLLITAALYLALIFIRPTGENWGRGWNMIAFLIYSAPTAVIAGVTALLRLGKSSGRRRAVARIVATAAFIFPIVCIVVIRMKA